MKKLFCFLVLCFLYEFSNCNLFAQEDAAPLAKDSIIKDTVGVRFLDTLAPSGINIEAGKLNTTWDFKTDIVYTLNTNFGLWQLRNSYTGTAITSINDFFRDIENLLLRYTFPVYDNLFFMSETKANVMSDRNSLAKSKLQRVSEQVGVYGILFDTLHAKLLYGAENNVQSDIKSFGHLLNFDLMLPQYNLDGYVINSAVISEWLFLKDTRKTNDIDITAGVAKQYTTTDNINFNVKYKAQRRNFLQTLSTTQTGNISTYSIEANTDKRITGNLVGRWSPLQNILLNLDMNLENIDVSRNYLYEIANNNNSKIARNFVEWNLFMRLSANIKQKNATHNIGFNLFDKSESNHISKKFNIESNEFASLQLMEAQKDNTTLNTNLFYFGNWMLSRTDLLKGAIALTKIEYNTPSKLNMDERDELSNLLSVEYVKQLSPILTLSSKLYYSQKHLVFIHRERSGQNNWNRVLSFSNEITIDAGSFYYNPQFEVMANYTAYDFEAQLNQARSYSIRYLIYRDSLRLHLWRDYILEGRTNFRLYEQSRLYWGNFAEFPLQRSTEISSTLMLFDAITARISAGIGVKLYYLKYGQLNNKNEIVRPTTTSSYAPALSIKGAFSKIEFNGEFWIDYRKQVQQTQWMPNIHLGINYILP